MSEYATCPACVVPIHNSGRGWQAHEPHHALVLLGLTNEQAEAVIVATYDAGISFEATLAALRATMKRPPEFFREAAEAIRSFAADQ